MEHNHNHEQPASLKNLVFAMVINGGIVVFEMVFGLMIQSMALISDAVHNLSDIAAMIFSYWAEKVSRRPANAAKTYGYRKIEFIAAFVNSIVLSVVIAFVFWETLKRFTAPLEIPGKEMLWVAVVAFVGNGAATLLLQKISARNFNMKSAWLHSLQDALFSLGVIVGALLITFFGWRLVDPLISLAICIVIAREIYKIVRQAVNSLMDAVPPGHRFHPGQERSAGDPCRGGGQRSPHLADRRRSEAALRPSAFPGRNPRPAKRSSARSRRCCFTNTGSTTRRSRSCPFRPGRWSTATTAIEGRGLSTMDTYYPAGYRLDT